MISKIFKYFFYFLISLLFCFFIYRLIQYSSFFRIQKIILNGKALHSNFEKQIFDLNQNIFDFKISVLSNFLKKNITSYSIQDTKDFIIKRIFPNTLHIIYQYYDLKIQIVYSKHSHYFLFLFPSKKKKINKKRFLKENLPAIYLYANKNPFYDEIEKNLLNPMIQSIAMLRKWKMKYFNKIEKIYYYHNGYQSNFLKLKTLKTKFYFKNYLSLEDWIYLMVIFDIKVFPEIFKWESIDLRFKPNFIVK